jgi:hypothetical protein
MKSRFAFGSLLVGILVFLAACGSNAPSQASQMPANTSQSGQVSPTGAQTVHVNLFDNKIESSMMTFSSGTPYHYVVTNKGHQTYTFAMMSQNREQAMGHMTLQERHQAALFMGDSIMPGQTMMFDYTFSSSMMGMGQGLEFACYQQGQNQVHMRLPFD